MMPITLPLVERRPRLPGSPTVAVLTLGCKLNQAESEAIARGLGEAGCRIVDRPVTADAYVINSCSVTHVADKKSRHLVRLARRLAPAATVLLTGCYPETAGPDLARATGADIVVPSRDKAAVVDRLLDALAASVLAAGARPAAPNEPPPPAGRTRAFVKAQEGCNDVCAFCIVPKTRGRERSLNIDEVVAEVVAREGAGAREVVITGTQLGAYGRDQDARSYGPAALIRAVLDGTAAPRIRFSSLQAQDITPDLLALWEDPRLCRHFHLALQSGSDTVLRRMRRRYTLAQYRDALALIRDHVPDVAVTTDIIVGFPGETEAEAEESLAFCVEAGFAMMHVFPYSRRPGTSAHLLREHLPEPVKRRRMDAMLALARESAGRYRNRFIGRTAPVLWEGRVRSESPSDAPVWEGLTDTYVRVRTQSGADLRNHLLPAFLSAAGDDFLWAESTTVSGPATAT
ncbi:MAG: MiaB/RimO family radical SAM methylthiotransferase [Dehalococcoidia bacterium]